MCLYSMVYFTADKQSGNHVPPQITLSKQPLISNVSRLEKNSDMLLQNCSANAWNSSAKDEQVEPKTQPKDAIISLTIVR